MSRKTQRLEPQEGQRPLYMDSIGQPPGFPVLSTAIQTHTADTGALAVQQSESVNDGGAGDGWDLERMVVVKQLPVIIQHLEQVSKVWDSELQSAMALACTEDTVKSVKKKRTQLTNQFNLLEERRKAVKKAVSQPYDEFNAAYNMLVADKYKATDKGLKERIDAVEDVVKQGKRARLVEYFNEVKKAFSDVCPAVEFLKFDDMGIKIGLNDTVVALSRAVKSFIDKTVADLDAISKMADSSAEIFIEYQNSRDLAASIAVVQNRKNAIEAQKRKSEEQMESAEQAQAAIKQAESAVDEALAENAPFAPPEASAPTEEIQPQEQLYRLQFAVVGTIEQLKELKQFLDNMGYSYEQL